jgi:hypothetical protein
VYVKEMQEVHTSVDLILLGVHGNANTAEVAKDFRKGLAIAEGEALARKKISRKREEMKKHSLRV